MCPLMTGEEGEALNGDGGGEMKDRQKEKSEKEKGIGKKQAHV